MVATPFAQVVVLAVALYCTGELTVALFAGLITVTAAKAGTVHNKKTQEMDGTNFKALPPAIRRTGNFGITNRHGDGAEVVGAGCGGYRRNYRASGVIS
jgi:hypothetical protein